MNTEHVQIKHVKSLHAEFDVCLCTRQRGDTTVVSMLFAELRKFTMISRGSLILISYARYSFLMMFENEPCSVKSRDRISNVKR